MPNYSEFFIADHHVAVARAKARDAGTSPSVDVPVLPTPGLSDLEIEVLGELAARKVHATGVRAELNMVDIALDSLYAVPDALVEVFAELATAEEPETIPELAAEWARDDVMESAPEVTEPLVRQLASMAATVHAEAENDTRLGLFFYSA
ncbi:hypothetical protein [Specibacter cremeus]|uniref:hypothetical protein n=1 Tax=Specibacter cremeus TaxID=1629051 RepID=UPI000F7B4057|nr:hypothetical protein [Specibacter cremeus]